MSFKSTSKSCVLLTFDVGMNGFYWMKITYTGKICLFKKISFKFWCYCDQKWMSNWPHKQLEKWNECSENENKQNSTMASLTKLPPQCLLLCLDISFCLILLHLAFFQMLLSFIICAIGFSTCLDFSVTFACLLVGPLLDIQLV